MPLYQTKTTVQSWYGSSVTIPAINSPKFIPFASSCMGIAISLLDKKTNKKINVGLSSDIETAYAAPDQNLIVISEAFMSGDFSAIGASNKLNAPKTVGAVLGVIVHEIGHFAYSPFPDYRKHFDFIAARTSKLFNQRLAHSVCNTLEDIYIEYQIARLAPTLEWTLGEINKLMLTDDRFSQITRQMKTIHSSENHIAEIMNFLLFAKVTPDAKRVSPFAARLFKMARSVTKMEKLQDRIDLSLALYDLVAPDKPTVKTASKTAPEPTEPEESEESEPTEPTEDEKTEPNAASGASEDDTEPEDDQEESDAALDGSEDATEDDTDDTDDETYQEDDQEESEPTEDDTDDQEESDDQEDDDTDDQEESEPEPTEDDQEDDQEDDDTEDDQEDDTDDSEPEDENDQEDDTDENDQSGESEDDTEDENDQSGSGSFDDDTEIIPQIDTFQTRETMPIPDHSTIQTDLGYKPSLDGHIVIESTITPDANMLEMDTRYVKLAEMARQRTNANVGFGEQKKRGRDLRQIYRIVTDQKVFSTRVQQETVKPMEVIIFLDCSGSMAFASENTTEDKITNAARAALGAASGLINGKCTVQVFGHTADPIGAAHKQLLIYRLLNLGESTNILARRLFTLVHRIGDRFLYWNRDGYALYEIAKKFQSQNKKRVLIVISDGAPNGNGSDYDGYRAIDHTRMMVNKIRQSGIDVYSISIDQSAYGANNFIYGKEFNTCAPDANAIDELIRQLYR